MKVVQLSMEIGRGRLVQLGRGSVDFTKGHGGPARLKKHISPSKFSLPIKDMLQIEPSNSRHKHTTGTLLVPETPQAIITSPVISMSGIVSNYRLQITYFIVCVSHGPNMTGL